MDLTVVFSGDRLTESKKIAIGIANDHGAVKSGNIYNVKFDKKSRDLIELLNLCLSWKLSHVLIDGKKTPVSDVLDVLECDETDECNGECSRGYPEYTLLIDQIEANLKGKCCDSEWIQDTISDLDSFEKHSDGSFKINKEKLKRIIERKYLVQINVCEKFDLTKIFKQIDEFPEIISISESDNDESEEFSYFSDRERKKLMETAEIVAPIFARVIGNHIENILIANLGSEKNAKDYAKKADALFSLHRYEESLNLYNKALQIDPTNSNLWYEKAFLLEIGFENYSEAIDAYDRAYEIDRNNIAALRRKGICFDSLGRDAEAASSYKKAIELYEEWLKKNPDDDGARNELQYTIDNLSAFEK